MKKLFILLLVANLWSDCSNEQQSELLVSEIAQQLSAGEYQQVLSGTLALEDACKKHGVELSLYRRTTFLLFKISSLIALGKLKEAEAQEREFYNALVHFPSFLNQDDLPAIMTLARLPEAWNLSGAHAGEIESRRLYLRVLHQNIENIHELVRGQVASVAEGMSALAESAQQDKEDEVARMLRVSAEKQEKMRQAVLNELSPLLQAPILRKICAQRLALAVAMLRNNASSELAGSEMPTEIEYCPVPALSYARAMFAMAAKKPFSEIRENMEKAAMAGSGVAQRDLATLYLKEPNNVNNLVSAYIWLRLMDLQFQEKKILDLPGLYNVDYVKSNELLAEVGKKLSPDQKSRADKKAYRRYTIIQSELSRFEKAEDEPLQLMEKRRKAAEYKACVATQRVIMGALEMYEMEDNEKRLRINKRSDMEILVRQGYMRNLPDDPGNPGVDNYRSDDCGNVYCLEHGSAEECLPCQNSECAGVNKKARNKNFEIR